MYGKGEFVEKKDLKKEMYHLERGCNWGGVIPMQRFNLGCEEEGNGNMQEGSETIHHRC